MDGRGNTAKTEKILLGVTALFLCLLFWLSFHDRHGAAAAEGTPVSVEAEKAVPQEAFMPDVLPLDINTATAEELAELPGIGAVLAGRIVDYRTEHGPFETEEALTAVSGIGEKKLAELEGRITVGQPAHAGSG